MIKLIWFKTGDKPSRAFEEIRIYNLLDPTTTNVVGFVTYLQGSYAGHAIGKREGGFSTEGQAKSAVKKILRKAGWSV